jgi:hypothetical protein
VRATHNPSLARLERYAQKIGLELIVRNASTRAFDCGDRHIRFRPGGKGVMFVQSFVGMKLDSQAYASEDRVKGLMRRAAGIQPGVQELTGKTIAAASYAGDGEQETLTVAFTDNTYLIVEGPNFTEFTITEEES